VRRVITGGIKLKTRHLSKQSGFTMIEVLVTAVILAIGLLGLAALQARMLGSELDAYQRSHALILVGDMRDRINNHREAFKAQDYSAVLNAGTGDGWAIDEDCAATGLSDVEREVCGWSQALKGASAVKGSGEGAEAIGAMREARGCIEQLDAGPPVRLRLSVAWQGMTPTLAPPEVLTCGSDADALSGDNATVRRVVSVEVTLANLVAAPF
jgi:type IV pilus assembly protein PilV